MKEAIRALTQLQETSNADKVPVAAAILELAGSQQMVPERLRSTGSGRYGSYTPAPLQGGRVHCAGCSVLLCAVGVCWLADGLGMTLGSCCRHLWLRERQL